MREQKHKFYRQKYRIIVAEDDDLEYIVEMYDNVYDMVKGTKKSHKTIASLLCYKFNGRDLKLKMNGKRYKIDFVEVDPEELLLIKTDERYYRGSYKIKLFNGKKVFKIFNNQIELANALNKTKDRVEKILRKIYYKQQQRIQFGDTKYEVEFIKV